MIARILALLVLGIAAPVLHAQNGSAVGFTDHRGENIPDVGLVDEHGAAVTMSAFKRQAYFLAFAYHTCPQLCGLVLSSFTESLRQVDGRVGSDFDVVVVSIDPADTPSSDAVAKQRYVARYGGDGHGWHFLTGDEQSIHAFAHAAGFDYLYDPMQKTFVHPAGVFFVRAGGVIGGHVEQIVDHAERFAGTYRRRRCALRRRGTACAARSDSVAVHALRL